MPNQFSNMVDDPYNLKKKKKFEQSSLNNPTPPASTTKLTPEKISSGGDGSTSIDYAPKILRDKDTGKISGIQYHDGKVLLGLTPKIGRAHV